MCVCGMRNTHVLLKDVALRSKLAVGWRVCGLFLDVRRSSAQRLLRFCFANQNDATVQRAASIYIHSSKVGTAQQCFMLQSSLPKVCYTTCTPNICLCVGVCVCVLSSFPFHSFPNSPKAHVSTTVGDN